MIITAGTVTAFAERLGWVPGDPLPGTVEPGSFKDWHPDSGWEPSDPIPGAVYLYDGIYVVIDDDSDPAPEINPEDIFTDDLVLVSEEEAFVGDYKYVTKIYTEGVRAQSDAGTYRYVASQFIYYIPGNSQSIHLATMNMSAEYTWDKAANTVSVNSKTAKYWFEEQITTGTYPIITEKSVEFKNDQGGFIGKKYASFRYVLDVEKAKGVHDEWALELDVNVEGTPTRKYK